MLKELDRKHVAIQVAGLRELVNNLPKARDGANCRIMRAAFERILPILRMLQLSGMDDCSVIAEFWKKAEVEIQGMIKQLLARKHTPAELACFLSVASYVDLGEQDAPFRDAWNQVVAAAAATR